MHYRKFKMKTHIVLVAIFSGVKWCRPKVSAFPVTFQMKESMASRYSMSVYMFQFFMKYVLDINTIYSFTDLERQLNTTSNNTTLAVL